MKILSLCFSIILILTPFTLSDTVVNGSYNLSNGKVDQTHIILKLVNNSVLKNDNSIFSLIQHEYLSSEHETLKNNLKIETKYDIPFNKYVSLTCDGSYRNYKIQSFGEQINVGIGLVCTYKNIKVGIIPTYLIDDREMSIKVIESYKVKVKNIELYHGTEYLRSDINKSISSDTGINLIVTNKISVGLNGNYEYDDRIDDDELSIMVTTTLKL